MSIHAFWNLPGQLDGHRDGQPITPEAAGPVNALSVDVEEYFHAEAFKHVAPPESWPRFGSRVVESTRRLLEILATHEVQATFFVVGWVAARFPGLVREVHALGHELACHSFAHRVIYSMDAREFREEVRAAKRAIEDASGIAIAGYRAPTFSVVRETFWALDVLREEGFSYDSSIFPIHHDQYGIPDAPRAPHRIALGRSATLVEFPMSTLRLAGQNLPFCGGGYFRLLPYHLVRAGIHRLNHREGTPAIVYLHPWELDADQPRLPVRGLTRFRHYVNLKSTAGKLDRLLRDLAFAPVAEVLRSRGFLEVPPPAAQQPAKAG